MPGLLLNDSYHIVASRGKNHLAILDAPFDGLQNHKFICQQYRAKCRYVEPFFPPEEGGQKIVKIHSLDFCNTCKAVLSGLVATLRNLQGVRIWPDIVTARLPKNNDMKDGENLIVFMADENRQER